VLSPELVRAKRSGTELCLVALDGRRRERALEIAGELLAVACSLEGGSRGELVEALGAVVAAPSEKKLADGLAKLLLDACELGEETSGDPIELRRALFRLAAARRRAGSFARLEVLDEVARERGIAAELVEENLYADLKSAHVLRRAPRFDAAELVRRHERASVQAVLLRAVRVTAVVRCSSAGAYRDLFRKLKFRRLLHRIEPLGDGRHRIEIDGPFSLFESVTKYGMALALVLPALEECDELELSAELRWGKRRDPLTFRYVARHRARAPRPEARLPDDVQALLDGVSALDTPWRAEPASELLELPGVGLCVPDLVFRHAESKKRVFLEALGYWSRDAVWRRVELAERGLPEPILFAASSRLRVSEEVLDATPHAALYVYKGVMSPRAVLERVASIAR
jgi:predicted nuclease of restriction endonuclease-like RecB superfamily